MESPESRREQVPSPPYIESGFSFQSLPKQFSTKRIRPFAICKAKLANRKRKKWAA
jgi:hypothetical protein